MPLQSPPLAAVPLIDARRAYAALKSELLAATERVLESGHYIMGPECEALENELAAYCQTTHAVACASGSDALLLALMALDIGPGDEVLLPSYTFFATASAVWRLGAQPVFVDIEPKTFTIDLEQAKAEITPRTRAIIPVHLYGQCADMAKLDELASTYGLSVIEDAAQSIGAEFQSRRAGSMGQMGCLSFYPTKNLGGFGDGGMVTTPRADLAARLRLLRSHGMEPRYHHQVVGINSRLDAIQAALLRVKLRYLEQWTATRQAHARRYGELLASYGLDRVLSLPEAAEGRRHVWNQYIVRVPGGRRDSLRAFLAERKIASEIYYPIPLHEQECFRTLGYRRGELAETERAARETLALPIFAEMTQAEQERVVFQIGAFFGVPKRRFQGLAAPKFLDYSVPTSPLSHSS